MTIVFDAIFWQLNDTGIARYWAEVLHKWSTSSAIKDQLICLVRDDFARTPNLPNLKYVKVPPLDYKAAPEVDRQMLQRVCDELDAHVFISSYYTCPDHTPSIFMAYDTIPEQLGHDLTTPMWQAKRYAISAASHFIAISISTMSDLEKFYNVDLTKCSLAYPGVAKLFTPKSGKGKDSNYLLLSGPGPEYKNANLLLDALQSAQLDYTVVATGRSAASFVAKAALSHPAVQCTAKVCTDRELVKLYQSAAALVYPSHYEGFGLPIAEAMAAGCPVITGRNSSLTEAGGQAALYIDYNQTDLLAKLCMIDNMYIRHDLVKLGLKQAKKFNWQNTADAIEQVLLDF